MPDETQRYFRHPQALVESDRVGDKTRVWAFAHVMAGAVVGARCNIGEQCFVESGAVLGDDVVIKNGVAVWEGVTVEDGAFIGPCAVFTNETFPRSLHKKPLARILVRRGASIGANATLVAPVTVGEYATVGAGAVVTRDVAPHELVVGSPARAIGHVCTCGLRIAQSQGSTCACGRRWRARADRVEEVVP